jgi:predicted DNA-binding ribbon-helix-helix protein
MKGPLQIVVRLPADLYTDLVAVAGQLGMTLSELIRTMVDETLPRYRSLAAAEGEKRRADKALREQVEDSTVELAEDLRRGRLELKLDELSAPKALAVAELVQRLRPGGGDAGPLAAELRAALLRALEAAPGGDSPATPPKPQRIRKYRRRKSD